MHTCLLHPVILSARSDRDPSDAIEEARSLVEALDVELVRIEQVTLQKPDPGRLIGRGKLEDLAASFAADEIDLVVVNASVSPVQQRNLEKAWKVKVLDRTALILEIFGARARTKEGVLQVDLAHLSYQKSRLVRSWTHLERQRGGGGFMGGPGETQIEADRRAIDDAIIRLKRQLSKVEKTRSLHRASRKKVPFPIVALVGYTNAGKSTIFNTITGAEVLAKDMVFATLDPTMRAIELPNGQRVILSDTVGFISDLPTQLVAAFRATLEEVLDADLVIHVRDIAHSESEMQAANVATILAELGISDAQTEGMVEVWNKIDLCPPDVADSLANVAERQENVVLTSATKGQGIDALLTCIGDALRGVVRISALDMGPTDGAARAWLYERKLVQSETATDDRLEITVEWSAAEEGRFFAEFPGLSPMDTVET